ncbi:MAG: hypothetical protein WA919_23230 [Coleofasciculaceae cyanobacterium]
MRKRRAVYAAPEDRDDFTKGAYLVILDDSTAKDLPLNRERAFEKLFNQIDEGKPPFDCCFPNGIGEYDLIFIPKGEGLKTMTKNNQDEQLVQPETEDIIQAASEVIELAGLKVDLAKAYRTAQQYKDLVAKIVAADGGHLSEEECKTASDKGFAKTIKALAEAKVKVSQWYKQSAGKHELILNELNFTTEEITKAIAEENGKAKSSSNESPETEPLSVESGKERTNQSKKLTQETQEN